MYQPITEFTASILGLLSEDDLRFLMETSLLLPEFFASLARYNPEAFQSLLMALTREGEIFYHELELALPRLLPPTAAHEFTDDESAVISRGASSDTFTDHSDAGNFDSNDLDLNQLEAGTGVFSIDDVDLVTMPENVEVAEHKLRAARLRVCAEILGYDIEIDADGQPRLFKTGGEFGDLTDAGEA